MTRHQLAPSPSTTVDVFSRDLPPVLTVDPGDTIVLRSLNASGHLEPQTFPGEKVPTMASKKRSGHCLTGPIAVRGAVPGEVLAVRFISLRPDPWGYTVAAARNAAMGDALDAMLTWLQARYGVGKATVLAMASPVLDLRVTQVANQSWGVHALLPAGAIS
jgi:acetamidase/formamidase